MPRLNSHEQARVNNLLEDAHDLHARIQAVALVDLDYGKFKVAYLRHAADGASKADLEKAIEELKHGGEFQSDEVAAIWRKILEVLKDIEQERRGPVSCM